MKKNHFLNDTETQTFSFYTNFNQIKMVQFDDKNLKIGHSCENLITVLDLDFKIKTFTKAFVPFSIVRMGHFPIRKMADARHLCDTHTYDNHFQTYQFFSPILVNTC